MVFPRPTNFAAGHPEHAPEHNQINEHLNQLNNRLVLTASRVEDLLQVAGDSLPTHITTAITGAEVDLRSGNRWTVAAPVTLNLPSRPDGSQYTVHVASGFQNITWPNGTEIFGLTTDDEDVWLTLVRDTDRWNVLVSSQKSGGGSPALDEPLATNLFPNPRPTGPTPHVRYGILAGVSINNDHEASMHYDVSGGGVRFAPASAIGHAGFKLPNLIADGRRYMVRFSYKIITDAQTTGSSQFTELRGPGRASSPNGPIHVVTGQMSRLETLFAKPEHQGRWIRSFPISIMAPPGNDTSDWWLTVVIGDREIAIRDFTVIDTTTGYELRDAFYPAVDSGAVWDGIPDDSPSSLYNIRQVDAEWMAQHEVAHYMTPFGTPMDDPEFVEYLSYPRGAVVSQPHLVSGSTANPVVARYANVVGGGSTAGWRNHSSGDGPLAGLIAFGGVENWTAGFPIQGFASEDWTYTDVGGGLGMIEVPGQYESGYVTMHIAGVAPAVENPAGAIFTFPVGMRPTYAQGAYVRTANDEMVYLEIMPTGEVFVRSPMAVGDTLGSVGTPKQYVALQWRMK